MFPRSRLLRLKPWSVHTQAGKDIEQSNIALDDDHDNKTYEKEEKNYMNIVKMMMGS